MVFTAGSRKWWHHLGQWKAAYVKKQPGLLGFLLDVGKQPLDDFGRLQTVVLKLSSWLSFICWFYRCRWLAHGWDCRKLRTISLCFSPYWLKRDHSVLLPTARGWGLLAPASFITLLLLLVLLLPLLSAATTTTTATILALFCFVLFSFIWWYLETKKCFPSILGSTNFPCFPCKDIRANSIAPRGTGGF